MKGYAKTLEHRVLCNTQTLAQLDKKFSQPLLEELTIGTSVSELLHVANRVEFRTQNRTDYNKMMDFINNNYTVAVFSLLCIPFQIFSLPQSHTSCKVWLMLDASCSHTSHFVLTWVESIHALSQAVKSTRNTCQFLFLDSLM